MNRQRILAILDKEWTQAFQGWSVKITTLLTPLSVLLGLLLQTQICQLKVIKDIVAIKVHVGRETIDLYTNPDNWHKTGDFYLIVFAVLPLFSVTKIAIAGILNDKESRSLEPLLATPLTGGEMFLGKTLAAILPAIVSAWTAYFVFIMTMAHWGIADTTVFGRFTGWTWILSVFVIAPLLALFQTISSFLVCSQTGSAKLAEHLATSMVGVISTAILAAIIYFAYNFYMYGKPFMGTPLLLKVAVGLVVCVFASFLLCINRFRRETILFKWN